MAEENELFVKYKETGDKSLRDELVAHYTYIAKILAYKSASVGVEYDDLYQVACMGLVIAAERFEPDKGVIFATFATATVMGEIKHFLRDKVRCIKVPRNLYEVLCKAENVRKKTGNVSVAELSKILDVPEKTLEEAYEAWDSTFMKSLEQEAYQGSGTNIAEEVGYDDNGFTVIENRDFLDYCMSVLSDDEKILFGKRFFEGKTQKKTAEEMGVSQMTVSRAEKKVIDKIKKLCKNDI